MSDWLGDKSKPVSVGFVLGLVVIVIVLMAVGTRISPKFKDIKPSPSTTQQ